MKEYWRKGCRLGREYSTEYQEDSPSSNKISDHLKALTPYVENGFWKLGGKVLDHFSTLDL